MNTYDIPAPTSLEELRIWHLEQRRIYAELMHASEARDEVEYYHKMAVFHERASRLLSV